MTFDAAWDEACHHCYHNLPYLALEWAMHGTEVPHYFKGELIGTSRRFDERLTVTLLKLFNTGDTLILRGLDPTPERSGQRLETMIAQIAVEGEAASANHDAPLHGGSFRAAHPLSDDELLAEFRRFRREPRR